MISSLFLFAWVEVCLFIIVQWSLGSFVFFSFTSSASLTASYAEDKPAFLLQLNCHSALSSSCDWLRAQGAAKLILASGSIDKSSRFGVVL